jgi:hypothetical protein
MTIVSIVAPVFALIALGYAAARWRWVSPEAQKGLAEFTFTLAVPALLFRTIASAGALPQGPLPIWLAFFGAYAISFALAVILTRAVLRRPAEDAASIAMTSTYGNVVMLGIPFALAVFGPAAAAPMAVILSIHTPTLWIAGTVVHQWAGRQSNAPLAPFVFGVVRDLAKNVLIVAILLGGLWRLTGLGFDPTVDRALGLLGQAGVPASLVALGMSLAGFAIKGQAPTLSTVIAIKLVAMPSLAALFAYALALPPVAAGVVILFAAMPAGANAFIFANKVDRAVNSASGAVALGTVLSALSVAAILALIGPGQGASAR